jgi:hypothetical protein
MGDKIKIYYNKEAITANDYSLFMSSEFSGCCNFVFMVQYYFLGKITYMVRKEIKMGWKISDYD